jgi:F-type H+-transporting ATPase subunit delta
VSDDNAARDAQQAAQMQPDVDRLHIGAVYAEALVAAAEELRATDEVVDVFDRFVSDALDPFSEFEKVLQSTLISHEERAAILDRVFTGRVPEAFLNFLKVVSRHDRMDCLRAIHGETRALVDKLRGRVPVELVTPMAIDDALARRVEDRLRELLGGEPMVTRRVDPELIGGAVVRVGDVVYDGSVATQLENLCQQMIDRSADEIQSRRNRFRNPG